MIYLSRTELNPLRSGTQALVSNPQRLHARVRGVVPPACPGRVLWRLEENRHKYDLYVLSPDFPSLDHLVEEAGWPGEHGRPLVAELAPLMGKLAVGREFGFRVTLNPVTSTRQSLAKPTASQEQTLKSRKPVRVGHRTAFHQLEWFVGRTTGGNSTWGFETVGGRNGPEVQISSRERLRFKKPASGHVVTLETVTFDGRLIVTDVEHMTNSIVNGIGKGKAYGCGLITLAPVR